MTSQEQPDSQAGDELSTATRKAITWYHIHSCQSRAAWAPSQTEPYPCDCGLEKIVIGLAEVYAERLATNRTIAAQKALPQPTDESCYNCGQNTFNYDGANRCIYCGGYQTDLERQQLGKKADHA